MDESEGNTSPLLELKCGCMINDLSGELHQECMYHIQANFMQ